MWKPPSIGKAEPILGEFLLRILPPLVDDPYEAQDELWKCETKVGLYVCRMVVILDGPHSANFPISPHRFCRHFVKEMVPAIRLHNPALNFVQHKATGNEEPRVQMTLGVSGADCWPMEGWGKVVVGSAPTFFTNASFLLSLQTMAKRLICRCADSGQTRSWPLW